MELESGVGKIWPTPGSSFDPAAIPGAVRKAGFAPREIRLVVIGEIAGSGGRPSVELEAGGSRLEIRLQGDRLAELETGRRLRLTGVFDVPEDPEAVPRLTVETWEPSG